MSRKSCAALTAAMLSFALPAKAQQLPDGPGKELAEANCNSCHTLLSRVGSGYTANGWNTVLRMMINQGAPLTADQAEPLKAYLIKSFPEKGKPGGVVIPGPAEVSFKEWQVPTPGSRPHDPLATKDGSLWFTGQLANVLGRLNPAGGTFTEFHLKTEHSGPHGLQEDKDGNIWYTGNTGSLIGKLDPKTGAVTEYPTPERGDPHTLIFDKDGILWFTMQNLNRIGRLDPKTGEHETTHAADGRFAALRHGIEFDGHHLLRRNSAPTRSAASIRKRWNSMNTSCPTRRPARGASPSPATTPFGTRTTRAAISVTSILQPAR